MDFYIYNTLSRKKEKFIPVHENKVGMYTCGPTVYDYAHIGNLRTYIFEDVLKKSLRYVGYDVKHVMNITDVGHLQSDEDYGVDKMQLGTERESKTVWDIANYYEKAFFKDCNKLNIERPTIVCRATDHIDDMINLIKVLENKGYTYISNGNVYYSIDKFKDYNKLANLTMDELKAGSRIKIDEYKKNPLDFVLWFTNSKFRNQVMQWDSPWGIGFPGWHIECSAMSIKYLGEKIDIHCGGVDHIPVHHTNEIAQSEAALGHKWVNYWMHGEFLVLDNGKMSKSKRDFLTLNKLEEKGFDPLVYRYFCLQSRYRKQLLFSFDALKDAENGYKKLKNKVSNLIKEVKEEDRLDLEKINDYRNKFVEKLSDDLNIPNVFTVLWKVIKDNQLTNKEKCTLIEDFDKVLSMNLMDVYIEEGLNSNVDSKFIDKFIQERNAARQNRDWTKADEIRDKLNSMNIEILDSKEGTKWKLKK
ncbi:cysteine--tRNA ligase [Clostridium sp. JN-1]|uniref:cysteine--tRNA ligase n=1 Tax=Clostridium sp. JN-1 TaxID=2483110 RepID=UPI000F0B8E1B|nr:cysteine--tRNA ligase [Clostridium sp. JN-1]